jgi:hypothetical protein
MGIGILDEHINGYVKVLVEKGYLDLPGNITSAQFKNKVNYLIYNQYNNAWDQISKINPDSESFNKTQEALKRGKEIHMKIHGDTVVFDFHFKPYFNEPSVRMLYQSVKINDGPLLVIPINGTENILSPQKAYWKTKLLLPVKNHRPEKNILPDSNNENKYKL